MKTKVTITLDQELLSIAKEYASRHNCSLSRLIEKLLQLRIKNSNGKSFSQKWRGRLSANPKKGERYRKLEKKYL